MEYHVVNKNTAHLGIANKGDFPFTEKFTKEFNEALSILKENGFIDSVMGIYKYKY